MPRESSHGTVVAGQSSRVAPRRRKMRNQHPRRRVATRRNTADWRRDMDAKRGAVGIVASLTLLLTLAAGPWAAASTGEPSPPWGSWLGTDPRDRRWPGPHPSPGVADIHLTAPVTPARPRSSPSAVGAPQGSPTPCPTWPQCSAAGSWSPPSAAEGAGRVLLQEEPALSSWPPRRLPVLLDARGATGAAAVLLTPNRPNAARGASLLGSGSPSATHVP